MQKVSYSRHLISIAIVGALTLAACKSARSTQFEKDSKAVCACTDVTCAKKAGTVFVDDYVAMMKENPDWTSAQGKKDSASITESAKAHNTCLSKFETRAVANTQCAEDATGKASTAGCTTCCREHGRVFDYWVDPMGAAVLGALGGPKNKGCGCK